MIIVGCDLDVSVVSFSGNSQSDTTILASGAGYVDQDWGTNASFSCTWAEGVCQ